jgi:P4 family phage/plasmid primase-like protien
VSRFFAQRVYTSDEWDQLATKPPGTHKVLPDGSVRVFADSDQHPDAPQRPVEINLNITLDPEKVEQFASPKPPILFGTRGDGDVQQAEWLAEQFNNTWRFDHSAGHDGQWLGFRKPGIWFPDKVRLVHQKIAELASAAVPLAKTDDERKARLKLAGVAPQERALVALSSFPGVATLGDEWDQKPHLLGVANGIVDLTTGTLRDGRPEDLVTRSTGIGFDPNATCPTIDQFLVAITSDREGNPQPEMVEYLLTVFGAALFGHTRPQQFWLFIGPGGGGKGTLARLVMFTLGGEEQYAVAPSSNMYTEQRWAAGPDRPRADLIALKGKRLAYISEPKSPFDDLLLLNHAGGDNITARTLFSGIMLTWQPTHTIIFSSNTAPSIKETGVNMRRRLRVVPFVRSFAEHPDTELQGKLEAEAEGFLALLVKYAVKYHANPALLDLSNVPEVVAEASKAFIEANDPLAQFVTAHVEFLGGAKEATMRVYDTYKAWHRGSGRDDEVLSQVKFTEALMTTHQHAIDKRRDRNPSKTMTFFGLRLVGTDSLDYYEGD